MLNIIIVNHNVYFSVSSNELVFSKYMLCSKPASCNPNKTTLNAGFCFKMSCLFYISKSETVFFSGLHNLTCVLAQAKLQRHHRPAVILDVVVSPTVFSSKQNHHSLIKVTNLTQKSMNDHQPCSTLSLIHISEPTRLA